MTYMGDKIEEDLEKMWRRRQAIWQDLRNNSITLSPASQVALIAKIAVIDLQMTELEKELDNLEWHNFIRSAWEDEDVF